MSSVIISGDTSGAITVSAPAVAGTNTLTLQAATATNAVNTLATAVSATSGTSIDFTGLPSWIKRITVMFNGVSTSGTSVPQIQIGTSGGVQITGYAAIANQTSNAASVFTTASTTGFPLQGATAAANIMQGFATLVLMDSSTNAWAMSSTISVSASAVDSAGGIKTLSATLDRIRITTVGGTDTFDAGTVNILYEG